MGRACVGLDRRNLWCAALRTLVRCIMVTRQRGGDETVAALAMIYRTMIIKKDQSQSCCCNYSCLSSNRPVDGT